MNRGSLYPQSPRRRERDSSKRKLAGIAGDVIPQIKHNNHIRILLHNCSGLGQIKSDRELNKYSLTDNTEQLKIFCESKGVDLVGLTETNTDWRKVEPDCQLWKVMREWAPISRSIVSNNRRVPATIHKQWGGTAMMCFNDVCAFENGKDRSRDFRGLGRWTSMTFAGRMNAKITLVFTKITEKLNYNENLTKAQAQKETHRTNQLKVRVSWRNQKSLTDCRNAYCFFMSNLYIFNKN